MEFPWRVKQRQANEHIGRLAAASDEYVTEANLELRYDRDTDAGTVGVRLHADSDPPLALGATIGDVLHNLRSALDSVAWEACQRAGVTPIQEKGIYFPIGIDPEKWPALAQAQLPNVSADHLEVFMRSNPGTGTSKHAEWVLTSGVPRPRRTHLRDCTTLRRSTGIA